MIILIVLAVVFLSIYIGIKEPISESLEENVLSGFELTAYNKYQVFNVGLLNIKNNAASLSSRSSIKEAMGEYLRGEITLEELREYTIPRYEEEVAVFDRSRTAARVTIDGKMIHVVGPDTNIRNYIQWDAEEVVISHFSHDIVSVQSPVMEEDEILGFDIILTDIRPIIKQMEMGSYVVTFPLIDYEDGVINKNGKIISYIYSDLIDRTIAISIDESVVYGPIQQQREKLYLRYFLVLATVFLIIQFLGIRYIEKFVEEQYRLKNLAEDNENEKKILIDQMNQGFLLIKATSSPNNDYTDYEVIDVNATFESMSSLDREDIIGKSVLQIISIGEELDGDQIDEVLRNGESRQFEYYVKSLDRWWNLSVYRPKESYLAIICDDITEKKNIELKLKVREETMRITLDIAGEGLWDWHFEEGLVYHNKKWCEIMGVEHTSSSHRLGEFVGQVHPDDEKHLQEEIANAMAGEGDFYSEYRMLLNDGRIIWIRDRGTLLADANGKPIRMLGSMADVTQKKQAEEDLFLEKEIFQSTLLSVEDGIISTDVDGHITVLNPAAEEIIGWTQDEALGKSLSEIFNLINPKNKKPVEILSIDKQSVNGKLKQTVLVTRSGKECTINSSVASIRLPNNEITGFVIVFRDISEVVERQKKIEYMSFHDELTGLYNRRYTEDALRRLDTKRNLPFTVMEIDMNNLKLTNDIFGHEMGDRIIRETAELLKETFRAEDIIARTGGDEFLILLPKTSKEEAEEIKDRIQKTAEQHKIGSLSISLAVGFSVKTQEEERIEDVLRAADAYMYEDKHKKSQDVKKEIILTFLEDNRNKFDSEEQHNKDVSKMAAALYKALGKPEKEVEEFRNAVKLHDIGKIIIPVEVLNKKEAFTDSEWLIIRRHPQVSYEILRILGYHNAYAKAILYHHERIDGKGYPEGLKGDEIPLESRIISIADAYESMTSDRMYKKIKSKEEAIKELRENAGKQFDAELVELFVRKALPNIS